MRAESGGLLVLPLGSAVFWIWIHKKFSTAARYGPIDGVQTRIMEPPYVPPPANRYASCQSIRS